MARNSPFEDVERFVEEMQKRLDERTVGERPAEVRPSFDVVEHDAKYVVTVDLPGHEADDVDVELAGRALTVEAEQSRDETVEEDDGTFIRKERARSMSTQRVEFPGAVRESEATATMQNGVLTVTVPKADPEQRGTSVDIE